jgi:2-phospho-L-lactate guanylyltransferase
MSVAALIPVKGFANAKQRLAGILGARERALLAEVMFRDMLSQTRKVRAFDTVFVVTASPEVSRIAAALGASVIAEPSEKGETEAVAFGLGVIKEKGIQAALVIPADIPLLNAADLESLCEQQLHAPSVLLVPSHDEMGTNALLLTPPDVLKLRFGYDSFSYHREEAAAKGVESKIIKNERIALDIDEPKDLRRFLSVSACGATRRAVLAMRLPGFAFAANS